MSRKADPVKRQQWTERLERFARSGQTVAPFCQAEGVSIPSFHQWKRKLREAARQRQIDSPRSDCFLPAATPAAPAFKPVWIATPGNVPGVTLRLPNGIVMELGGPDLPTLSQVLGQLLAHQDSRGADAC